MGQPKRCWVTVGNKVELRRTGEMVLVLEFKGNTQADRIRVEMPDGRAQWVRRKDVRIAS